MNTEKIINYKDVSFVHIPDPVYSFPSDYKIFNNSQELRKAYPNAIDEKILMFIRAYSLNKKFQILKTIVRQDLNVKEEFCTPEAWIRALSGENTLFDQKNMIIKEYISEFNKKFKDVFVHLFYIHPAIANTLYTLVLADFVYTPLQPIGFSIGEFEPRIAGAMVDISLFEKVSMNELISEIRKRKKKIDETLDEYMAGFPSPHISDIDFKIARLHRLEKLTHIEIAKILDPKGTDPSINEGSVKQRYFDTKNDALSVTRVTQSL